jgi:uncharacterized protein (DUF2461 family)
MRANRDRYKECVVEPFRRLLEEIAPGVLRLHPDFDTSGRTGVNFSRINRDTRFAKDKTPYRTQMYLKLSVPFNDDAETGQLYFGLSLEAVTAGFRIYSGSKRKESALAQVAEPRLETDPRWPMKQRKRLSSRYESYWYSTRKGHWSKHAGWPVSGEEWKKLQGWVVRRELNFSALTRSSFPSDLVKIFRDVHPLLSFTSLQD